MAQGVGAMSAQDGHRHAVQVTAGGDVRGVEVGVGIEPNHPQIALGGAAVGRHRADRAYRQTVVSTHEQGNHTLAQGFADLMVSRMVPLHTFRQMTVALVRRLLGIGGALQVATIAHIESLAHKRLL